jgi:hypothetical protein
VESAGNGHAQRIAPDPGYPGGSADPASGVHLEHKE